MTSSRSCIFCSIISGQAPVAAVYEDNEFIALMDKYPISRGHTLLVPKAHYDNLLFMTLNEVSNMYWLVAAIAKSVVSCVRADGFSIGQNNGRAANQIVPHVHVHIVPRYDDDSSDGKWPSRKPGSIKELPKLAEKIRASLDEPLISRNILRNKVCHPGMNFEL
jgi:histidine triad (HIT) family protein